MFNLPFDSNKPIVGKASVIINKKIDEVFEFVGENFFENYPKWATDVIEFEPLDGHEVVVGAKARQLRKDQGKEVSSTFQVDAYQPMSLLSLKGLSDEYRDCYLLENDGDGWATRLTYTFELLNIDIFMRPFEKLLRIAIEDGAETTAENINKLLSELDPV
jgi:hypothetical protein